LAERLAARLAASMAP
jgi:hypothetical protein